MELTSVARVRYTTPLEHTCRLQVYHSISLLYSMLMSTLIAGLLIPNDERKRPQRDENHVHPKFPWIFRV